MANDDNGADGPAPTSRDLPLRSASNPEAESFDIVATYHRLLTEDPDLTMPMAAIEALIAFLGHSNVSTVYETIDLVKTQSERLQRAVTNPIALSHGTDLFQQYLIMSLKQPAAGANINGGDYSGSGSTHESFEVVRQHLLRNSRLFATRAKNARERIAANARRHIYDGATILAHGGSRVVGTLLGRAAEPQQRAANDHTGAGHNSNSNNHQRPNGPVRFQVIYAVDPALETESNKVVAALRAKGVPVATIPLAAVSYAMAKVDLVVVGAEAVAANGGVISRLGTFQIAQLARQNRKPFYVAAEQHKFGKTFPLNQFDFSFDQGILDFHASKKEDGDKPRKEPMANPIDYTPPEYIESFFSDHKILTPAEVAKEVIDMLM